MSLFREFRKVKQESLPGRRRWFEADGMELVVWLDQAGHVTGFQLCYDLGRGEHALTWREAKGFVHSAIDAGDQTPLQNLSPILKPTTREPPWAKLAEKFDAHGASLDPALRRLVQEKLREQAEAGPPR
jgi:hypothetical protein